MILLGCWALQLSSQEVESLTLEEAIEIAQDNSLLARQAENEYLSGYWRFRSYQAELKPFIDLTTVPVSFNRTVVERYDSELNSDVYRQQQTFNSTITLSLNQRIGLTGGSVFMETDFGRLETLGEDGFINYFATPVRVGVSQMIGGFNEFKWKKQIEPLINQKSQQAYILAKEQVALQVVQYFFEWATQQLNYELAEFNLANADTLYKLGEERYKLGTLTQDDLLELEMSQVQAQTELVQARLSIQQANYQLNILLGYGQAREWELILPNEITAYQVDPDLAIRLAHQHHPDMLDFRQQVLEAQREVEQTLKENRFQARFNASFGLNQQSGELSDVYNFPMEEQQRVLLSLNIPLLDWGMRKGQVEMARSNQEVVAVETAQAQLEFDQEVRMQALEFNVQPDLVQQARDAEALAIKRYEITRQRFVLGSVDLIKLNTSLESRNQARRNVLQSLYTYWEYVYTLRSLTLYDFETDNKLNVSIEE